jgi:hypothetical protein
VSEPRLGRIEEPDPDDFAAVVYDGDVRCIECLPPGVDIDSAEVDPILAGEEWCGPAVCRICRFEHDYMRVV